MQKRTENVCMCRLLDDGVRLALRLTHEQELFHEELGACDNGVRLTVPTTSFSPLPPRLLSSVPPLNRQTPPRTTATSNFWARPSADFYALRPAVQDFKSRAGKEASSSVMGEGF
jgi:hypothetical protein